MWTIVNLNPASPIPIAKLRGWNTRILRRSKEAFGAYFAFNYPSSSILGFRGHGQTLSESAELVDMIALERIQLCQESDFCVSWSLERDQPSNSIHNCQSMTIMKTKRNCETWSIAICGYILIQSITILSLTDVFGPWFCFLSEAFVEQALVARSGK